MAINLKPAPKRLSDNAHSWGNTEQQKAVAGIGGQGHPFSTGGQQINNSAAARPLASAYGSLPKKFGPSPVHSASRSRNYDSTGGSDAGDNLARSKAHTNDDMHGLGAAILTEAVLSGSTKLPAATSEN